MENPWNKHKNNETTQNSWKHKITTDIPNYKKSITISVDPSNTYFQILNFLNLIIIFSLVPVLFNKNKDIINIIKDKKYLSISTFWKLTFKKRFLFKKTYFGLTWEIKSLIAKLNNA